ncbi:MAG: glycerol-3-phosphate dehydrogenase/oxidase [Verrucomicrobia bacterium]|nr:glycerol-3-phosphate dehydrogenase/oxidase [Verrucomicrobiota bacterium]
MIANLGERTSPWDMVIIGGGATGLGTAVDAASRGYDVVLFEQCDFAKGTSSRSTKLVHGGVRYLQQGNVSLVTEALKERGLLLQNAPHLVDDVAFIVPSYEWWESPFYGIGLKVYDLLAGRYGFGKSETLSREEVIAEIPSINPEGLRGGTRYYDGQFDDARLAINLATTAFEQGATLLNYARVSAINKDEDGVAGGVTIVDAETGQEHRIDGRVVINATGPFADAVRRLDNPDAKPIIAPSQGVHLVLERSFISGDAAIMVPHTDDGRVMFAIPWHDVAVVGTTDTPIDEISLEPRAFDEEIDYILETANRYLQRPATRDDILSVFAGIRPLVKAGDAEDTAALSREHAILVDPDSGLLTAAGGKWTTYRKMAEDIVDQAFVLADLEPEPCMTRDLQIHGYHRRAERFGRFDFYGSDAAEIENLTQSDPALAERVHPELELTAGEIIWFCRREMARTVDDVLARRSRSLLFNARAAMQATDAVARVMARELGHGKDWIQQQSDDFRAIASRYQAR